MARTNSTNFTGPLQYPIADAATDLFKKEDVQVATKALDQHDHTTGKGLPIPAGAIPNGTITSAMIADGTIDTADLKDGSVTTAKIADGTIATADLANNAVTNAKLGTDTARLNLLTNGGFEIWQRGNGPFTTTNAWTADRWAMQVGSGSTVSVSRDSANADLGSQYCAAVTYTHAVVSGLFQNVSSYSEYVPSIRGKAVTVSIRVRTSVANSARLRLNDGVTGIFYSPYHSGSGAYETISLTYSVASAPTVFNLMVEFNVSGTYYIDNAMLVVGSVAADYAPLHPADDLARCNRYYEVVGYAIGASTPAYEPFATALCVSTTVAQGTLRWTTRKAVTPTVTFTAASTFVGMNNGGGMVACTAIAANYPGYGGCRVDATLPASTFIAGQATLIGCGAGANAGIYVEANP